MAHQYTPEEQAAAWAAYYAQQGYTVDPSAGSSSAVGGAGYHTPYDPEAAQQASAYQYNPQPEAEGGGYMADGKWVATPAGQGSTQPGKGKGKDGKDGAVRGKRETVIRKAGGKVWEDQTLLEWDPFRGSVSMCPGVARALICEICGLPFLRSAVGRDETR
ncbi:hypothetical protein QFC22_000735 [Naganishia vaughanmartiniae]|uniref:Uncharacterized protein n=1 Tax=Naganishia vaughanmartiniae TaxID=1424756 RepID=A0ACC2XKQ1_9TREE|nr:hypothetical protein QFC22_000735 [Naganishia vaughanmartiniae]